MHREPLLALQSKEEIAKEIIGRGKDNLLAAIHQGYRQTFALADDMIQSTTALMKEFYVCTGE
ncbi:hypothetical protein PO124_14705 [Bacillus licheniformis]|nr:hypothetical protein [Bacillus licheniformis]